MKNLQTELLSTLRTLQEEQQQQDSEKPLDDDKVPKATCQCSWCRELSLSVRGISIRLAKCIGTILLDVALFFETVSYHAIINYVRPCAEAMHD